MTDGNAGERIMKTHRSTLGATLVVAAAALGSGLVHAQEWTTTTDTHRFMEVRNGIYLTQTTAQVFNSNSLVIVNDEDVVIVDSHVTPAKARDLIASIPAITDKPVTALINSHYHWDHAHGNQEFADIPIIGHEYTRMKLATAAHEEPTYLSGLAGNAARLEQLAEQIEAAEDDEEREGLETYHAMFAAHAADFDEIAPLAPDVTMNEKMTLFRGGREIQVIFLGRAHTGGDVVVYFPQDKLVFTGDILFGGPSFLGDGYVDEWPRDAGEPQGAGLRHRRSRAWPAVHRPEFDREVAGLLPRSVGANRGEARSRGLGC